MGNTLAEERKRTAEPAKAPPVSAPAWTPEQEGRYFAVTFSGLIIHSRPRSMAFQ
jgi:hypothetical protein